MYLMTNTYRIFSKKSTPFKALPPPNLLAMVDVFSRKIELAARKSIEKLLFLQSLSFSFSEYNSVSYKPNRQNDCKIYQIIRQPLVTINNGWNNLTDMINLYATVLEFLKNVVKGYLAPFH